MYNKYQIYAINPVKIISFKMCNNRENQRTYHIVPNKTRTLRGILQVLYVELRNSTSCFTRVGKLRNKYSKFARLVIETTTYRV